MRRKHFSHAGYSQFGASYKTRVADETRVVMMLRNKFGVACTVMRSFIAIDQQADT